VRHFAIRVLASAVLAATVCHGSVLSSATHARDRVSQVTHPEGWVLGYTYDAAGNRATGTLPNGTSTAWTYDQRNRVTKVEHRKGTTNVVTYTYVWNAQGLRSREIAVYAPNVQTCQSDHTYDALGRLTRTVIAGNGTGNPCMAPGNWNYTYDAAGNLLRHTDTTVVGGFLYYNRARWLDPRVGRFLGIDPHPGEHLLPEDAARLRLCE
jgi:YD repeat-containing protein